VGPPEEKRRRGRREEEQGRSGGVIEGVRLTCGPHERVVGIKEKYEGR
jgi:hypothetical protein